MLIYGIIAAIIISVIIIGVVFLVKYKKEQEYSHLYRNNGGTGLFDKYPAPEIKSL